LSANIGGNDDSTQPAGIKTLKQKATMDENRKPLVSIIMGSTSDLSVMEGAAKVLNELQIPFEMNALSAHRTPEKVEQFARSASGRGIRVIIAGAGMAAHLPGVIAAMTPIPVIGVPIKASLEGLDALLAIVQMPPGIPVATVAINGATNAGILAAQILAVANNDISGRVVAYKENLKEKIIKANQSLAEIKYEFKV
jgi:5-(carboxyamino)imidazole ribonucleotide mutase